MNFSQIAFLLVFASIFGIIAKFLKQPLLVGYLIGGVALGVLGLSGDLDTLSALSQIGVSLLLFLMGLEMNIHDFRLIGKTAVLAGIGQITITTLIGFLIAGALGFAVLPSLYIGIALCFSSTIIMVKILSEKKDVASLYGKIAIGILLVQDFVAIFLLIFLSGIGNSSGIGNEAFSLFDLLPILVKSGILLFSFFILSKKVLPTLVEKILGGSQELLFISAIAWALGASTFVKDTMGFSFEIGGFLAGLSLSNLPEHLQVSSKTKPLRDFFLTIFFLLLGTRLIVSGFDASYIFPMTILSLYVLIGNPLIVLALMGFLGYKKRTSFLTGLSFSQISEFSLILVAMGESMGHYELRVTTLVIGVGVVTMTTSTYLIFAADKIYDRLKRLLAIFEKRRSLEVAYSANITSYKNHVVIVGCDRTGKSLLRYFLKKGLAFLVVDFNPKVFTKLMAENVPIVFGDINDSEILEKAKVNQAELVISTISNQTDNLRLLEYLKLSPKGPTSLFTSSTKEEAISLYESGASYVVVPEVVAGEHIRHLLKIYGQRKRLIKAGKSHFGRLML